MTGQIVYFYKPKPAKRRRLKVLVSERPFPAVPPLEVRTETIKLPMVWTEVPTRPLLPRRK